MGDLLGNPYQKPNPTLSLGSTLSINTPAPIIGTNGVTYKPGQFTTLTNPGLANPYLQKPTGKVDTNLKKPSEMKLDRTKSDSTLTTPESRKLSKTTKYVIVGLIAIVGIALLMNSQD